MVQREHHGFRPPVPRRCVACNGPTGVDEPRPWGLDPTGSKATWQTPVHRRSTSTSNRRRNKVRCPLRTTWKTRSLAPTSTVHGRRCRSSPSAPAKALLQWHRTVHTQLGSQERPGSPRLHPCPRTTRNRAPQPPWFRAVQPRSASLRWPPQSAWPRAYVAWHCPRTGGRRERGVPCRPTTWPKEGRRRANHRARCPRGCRAACDLSLIHI